MKVTLVLRKSANKSLSFYTVQQHLHQCALNETLQNFNLPESVQSFGIQ